MSASRHARLIIDGPALGVWNMAVDEVLLQAAQRGETTLRFYQWSPATLSLGYFQAMNDRQLHVASQKCPIVRRTTGGGAILHDRELTYSICLPCRERFSASAESIYDALHDSLIEVLADWQISARRCATSDSNREGEFLCFQRRARGDVLVDEWKIAGSAQRRHGGAVLQHGSVLLAASAYAPELKGIQEIVARSISFAQLTNDWVHRIQDRLDLRMDFGELTAAEVSLAKEVVTTRETADKWLFRR